MSISVLRNVAEVFLNSDLSGRMLMIFLLRGNAKLCPPYGDSVYQRYSNSILYFMVEEGQTRSGPFFFPQRKAGGTILVDKGILVSHQMIYYLFLFVMKAS